MKKVFLFLWIYIFQIASVPFSDSALKDYETWMGTYFQGKKLGFAHTKVEIETGEIIIHTEVGLICLTNFLVGAAKPTSID